MVIHDKAGKEIEAGALVDIHIPQLATALVLSVNTASIITPDGQQIPPHIQLQILVTIPAGRDGGVWCYVVKDAPKPDEKMGEKKGDVVSPFAVH